MKKWHLIQIMLYNNSHYFYIIIFPQEVFNVQNLDVIKEVNLYEVDQ